MGAVADTPAAAMLLRLLQLAVCSWPLELQQFALPRRPPRFINYHFLISTSSSTMFLYIYFNSDGVNFIALSVLQYLLCSVLLDPSMVLVLFSCKKIVVARVVVVVAVVTVT